MKLSLLPTTASGTAQFYWRDPENSLLVQETVAAGVLIYAVEDNLTPKQQEVFIQYLRAEGFIAASSAAPGRFGKCALSQEQVPVRWIVDSSCPEIDPAYALHIRRLSLCTLGIVVVWLAFMSALIFW